MAAFLALSAAVPMYVAPQLAGASRIHVDAGQRLRLLAQMRGVALEIRSAASLARFPDEKDPEQRLASGAARLSNLAAQFESTAPGGGSLLEWQHARDESIPELLRRAKLSVVDAQRGVRESDNFHQLVTRSVLLDRQLERVTAEEETAVARIGDHLHRSLLALVLACIAIGLGGAAVAAVFLRRELEMVHAFAQESERRISDLDAFAGRVAHDLRNPLQTILLGLRLMRRAPGAEPRLELLDRAERAAGRLERMIHELLEFSRHGTAAEGPRAADLSTVVDGVLDEVRTRAERAGVALRVQVPSAISVAMPDTAIHSVMANLIDNGIKYAATRDDRFVEVRADVSPGTAWIRVSDNGLGIPREKVALVFEPFYRVSDQPDGYGIGLATVKRLLDAHGGEIRVDSTLGEGTTFTVQVPTGSGPARQQAS